MMVMSRGCMQVSLSLCVEDDCYHRNVESDENENGSVEQCEVEACTLQTAIITMAERRKRW
jgi:hypothetical protein